MEILATEHVSRLGLDDAFSAQLGSLLASCSNPLEALQHCNWTIPPHEELAALNPKVRAVALVPIVSVEVSRLLGKLNLSADQRRDLTADLIAAGCAALGALPARWADELLPPVRNYKNHAWTAVRRSVSAQADNLKGHQVTWCPDTGEPIGGHYPIQSDGVYLKKPFTDWDGIYPALRALFDCAQDKTDRDIIKARWADGRCITGGLVTPIQRIARALSLPESEVLERLYRLRYRWACFINRTQRFTKHLPAMPHRHHVSA